jgi:hypothetical protein
VSAKEFIAQKAVKIKEYLPNGWFLILSGRQNFCQDSAILRPNIIQKPAGLLSYSSIGRGPSFASYLGQNPWRKQQ